MTNENKSTIVARYQEWEDEQEEGGNEYKIILPSPTTIPEDQLPGCEECGGSVHYGDVAVGSPPASSGYLLCWSCFITNYLDHSPLKNWHLGPAYWTK